MNTSENYKYIRDNLQNMFLIHEAEKALENKLFHAQIKKLISDIVFKK